MSAVGPLGSLGDQRLTLLAIGLQIVELRPAVAEADDVLEPP